MCLSVWELKCVEILSTKTTKQWQTFYVIKSSKEKRDIGKTLNLKLGYAYTCGFAIVFIHLLCLSLEVRVTFPSIML
jgi:hypothetical protein